MRRLGILLSGRGSNFEAIADSVDQNKIDAEIAVVISNNPKAPGLERAKARGLKQVCISSRAMERDAYDWLVVQQLQQENVELVCLAGYMRLLSSYFVNEYPERILNIHPSLLPSFPGLEAQLQALENGVRYTGCTVHFVDEYMDRAPSSHKQPFLFLIRMMSIPWQHESWSRSIVFIQKQSIWCLVVITGLMENGSCVFHDD